MKIFLINANPVAAGETWKVRINQLLKKREIYFHIFLLIFKYAKRMS